jgi:hypothetical protein
MDFSLTHSAPFGGSVTTGQPALLMRGEIVPGDYDRLIKYYLRSGLYNGLDVLSVKVILSSPGGDVTEAIKIGKFLKSIYATVGVGPTFGKCASACFIIFASAVDRESEQGFVGIHRPYISPERMRSLSPGQAETLETKAMLDAEEYLHQLRVPTGLVELMFENASNEIHWLTDDELERQLGERPPWYEEFLIARCGLDKSVERRYLAGNNHALLSQMVTVDQCGGELTRPDAVKNFSKALAPYTYGFTDEMGIYRLAAPGPSPKAIADAMAIVWQGQITVERHGKRYTTSWGTRRNQVIEYYGISGGQLDIVQGGPSPEALAIKLLNELIDKQEAFLRSVNELSARCAANPQSCEVSP